MSALSFCAIGSKCINNKSNNAEITKNGTINFRMKVSLSITITVEIEGLYKNALFLFEDLISEAFFGFKSDLIEEMCVGFVCVSPGFSEFFKAKRPKFYDDKTITSQASPTPEIRLYKHLIFDFIMDFETYLNAKDEKECLRVLAISFLKVLEELKYPGKVKTFEKERFNQTAKNFFIKKNIISEADIDCKQSE